MEVNLVAVYGSLRKGLHNHRVLGDSKFISEGTVTGFEMVSLTHYPYLRPEPSMSTNIVVEVYEVNEQIFANLDMLEGYPNYYDRKVVDVNTPEGVKKAWVYFIDEEPKLRPDEEPRLRPVVEGGDWVEYLKDLALEDAQIVNNY